MESFFKTLIGGTYEFYGVDNNTFCIGFNGARIVLEAMENESDGYRSYFDTFEIKPVGKIFFGKSIANVSLETRNDKDFTGWHLRDVDTNHIWLTVGTDSFDEYYPMFVFEYSPDKTRKL